MKSNQDLFLENQLCFALYSCSLTMGKAYQPLLKGLGVTYPQYLVLLILWQADQVSVSTLGQQLYLDSGTLTPLLKRLEVAKLICRERSSKDERQVIVSLTAAGKNLKKKASEFPKKILCAMESSGNEARAVTKTLGTLRASLLTSELLKKKK
ncbi:MAG: MarR family transcriptional regulator [Bdellovibrio sp.]|nr:MarR family transcriptional regulator [Bdellovibrio sp.]